MKTPTPLTLSLALLLIGPGLMRAEEGQAIGAPPIYPGFPTAEHLGVVPPLTKSSEDWLSKVTPESETKLEEGLDEALKEYFLFGTIWHGKNLGDGRTNTHRAQEMALSGSEFNAITAENCMKPSALQPHQGVFNFAPADEFVQTSSQMGHTIIGHTLVWKNDAPAWFFQNDDGTPAPREIVIERMVQHIATVVGRYRGKIKFWDVVNEAVDLLPNAQGKLEACLKPSPWLEAIGPEYIELAYRAAHEADPEAKLLYNDYNLYEEKKADFVIAMVKNLRNRGVPVHGIGYQGHMFLDFPKIEQVEYLLKSCRSENIPLSVTELDLSVLPNAWKHRGASVEDSFTLAEKFNPYPEAVPEAVLMEQAQRYREMFELFIKYHTTIERVSFWGVWDGNSWRNYKPMEGRRDYPLLFDRQFKKKPAYEEISKLLSLPPEKKNKREPSLTSRG